MLFAALPDPGSPGFPALLSIMAGFAGTSYGLWRGMPREEVQWFGFFSAYLGVGFGLAIYIVLLLTELY